MTTFRFALGGLLFLTGLGGVPRAAAQVDPPVPSQRPDAVAGGALFRQHCVKCHGADGTGKPARDRMPEIPNFTSAAWQKTRSNPQLLKSILEGKGEDMPSWSGEIPTEQARGLVLYVREFAPTARGPGSAGRQPQPPRASGTDGAVGSGGFWGKMLGWLGRFHPAAVNFPVALLLAAAVAEVLRRATGRESFAESARYCLWFGALTAVVAGVLGWFLAGFHVTDASWILTTHRWLGTTTVVCAGLVLALGEWSRRPEHRRARTGYLVALGVLAVLVLATGFFGGAVVFGLGHYAWPE